MPKMKTKRAAAKRYSMTGNGKVKFKRKGMRHLLSGKSRNTKRKLRKAGYVHPADAKLVQRCLPYGV